MLSVDCFKSMCMFANSEQGKTVKLYYLDLERIFKRFITLEFNQLLRLHNQTVKKCNYRLIELSFILK